MDGAYWYQPVGQGSDVFAVNESTGADKGDYPVVRTGLLSCTKENGLCSGWSVYETYALHGF